MSSLAASIFVILFVNSPAFAIDRSDSLKLILKNNPHDTIKVNAYLSLFDLYAASDTIQSGFYLQEALELAQTLTDDKWLCIVQLRAADQFRKTGKVEKAKMTLDDVKNHCLFDSDIVMRADYFMQLGNVNYIESEYENAIANYLQAQGIYDELKEDEKVANSLNNIGNVYWEIDKPDEALNYYQKALSIYQEKQNEKECSDILGNIGLIYRAKNDFEKALEYYFLSLDIDRKYGNTLSMAINLQNIGALYIRSEEFEKALIYLNESRNLSLQINDQIGVLYADHGIASVLIKQGDYNKAISSLLEALSLAVKLNTKEEVKNLYESLSLVYEKQGNLVSALEYRKLFEQLKDSLAGESYANRIKELEVKYETEKKDKQLIILAKEKEIQLRESQRQANLKNAFIAGFILLFLFAALITYTLRQRLKSQKILSAKDAELKEENFKRQLSELEMKALRAQINPHFLFNCISAINRMIVKSENESASQYLKKFAKLVRLIVENAETNEVSLDNELALIEAYIQLEELRFNGKIDFEISVDQGIEKENTYLPTMVLQPFVENAIWHGLMHKQKDESSQIKIEVSENADILLCAITDNGVGRVRSQELKDNNLYKTKSMGIKITEERLKLLKKEHERDMIRIIDLKDPLNQQATETRVEIKIPLS